MTATRGSGGASHPPGGQGLSVGGRVFVEGRPCTIVGAYRYRDGDFGWIEFRVAHPDGERWLTRAERPGPGWKFWRPLGPPLPEQGADSVQVGGVTYRLAGAGTAAYVVLGAAGETSSGVVDYADYEAGELMIGFERFDGGIWEVHEGRWLPAWDVAPG